MSFHKHPYQGVAKIGPCHREDDLMGVLKFKFIHHKLYLRRRVNLGPSMQCRLTFPHLLRSWYVGHFATFHSAWGFCFFSFEPASFHGVQCRLLLCKLPTSKSLIHFNTFLKRGCLIQMRKQNLVLYGRPGNQEGHALSWSHTRIQRIVVSTRITCLCTREVFNLSG